MEDDVCLVDVHNISIPKVESANYMNNHLCSIGMSGKVVPDDTMSLPD